VLEVWAELPVLLISVVFAALFIGKRIPGLREIWEKAGPQVALGQSIAWGQYVVGISLGLLVLSPVFGLDPVAGALIEIGFEGGHGTAAGLAGTFEEFGFAEGTDLALGLATIGLLAGVLIGTAIINWGVRTGRIALDPSGDPVEVAPRGHRRRPRRPRRPRGRRHGAEDDHARHRPAVDPPRLRGHRDRASAGCSCEASRRSSRDLGRRRRPGAAGPPAAVPDGDDRRRAAAARARPDRARPRRRPAPGQPHLGRGLDLIIVAALGTLSLEAIGGNLGPFVVLAVAGIVWNVGAFLVLAPRIVPEYPYERGLGDFGQSMGMTVTGLLLMRIADPPNRSGGSRRSATSSCCSNRSWAAGCSPPRPCPLIAQLGRSRCCSAPRRCWCSGSSSGCAGSARAGDERGADQLSTVRSAGSVPPVPRSARQDRPTISPSASRSMRCAAGLRPRPGIVRISPQIG
jgi:glutamate:Na+ symporter, ESS family